MLRGDARLVTLTGAGGVGKTRLAQEVGADVLDDYRDGAWLVEFGPLGDGRRVVHSVAEVLGVGEEPARALDETLVAALRPRHLLLILDNCEHVLRDTRAARSAAARRLPAGDDSGDEPRAAGFTGRNHVARPVAARG